MPISENPDENINAVFAFLITASSNTDTTILDGTETKTKSRSSLTSSKLE